MQIMSYSSPLPTIQQCSAIDDLLLEFAKVFEVLVGLPPLKGHEHQINLKEGTLPICEKPYRYFFIKNLKLRKLCMNCMILVLLELAKVLSLLLFCWLERQMRIWGGGGMCIDYKSLNKATVKDKYPILVVDELLDKLVVLPFSLCWILDQDIIKLG